MAVAQMPPNNLSVANSSYTQITPGYTGCKYVLKTCNS